MSVHEQQDCFWRGKHLFRSPFDNTCMTSDKCIRVLEIRGPITKNHLLRTMLPVRANVTCSTKWGGNRPCSVYQYSRVSSRLLGQNCKFFKFLLSLNCQKRLGYKENILKEK